MAGHRRTGKNKDQVLGVDLNKVTPDNFMDTLFNRFGGKELTKQVPETALRDGGFIATRFIQGWLVEPAWFATGVEALNNFGALKKIGVEKLETEQAKLIVQQALDAVVVVSGPAINAYRNYKDDKAVRREISAEMQSYVDAGLPSLRASSAIPAGQSENKVIAKLDKRLTEQYQTGVFQAASGMISGGVQYYATRLLDLQAQKDKIKELGDNKIEAIEADRRYLNVASDSDLKAQQEDEIKAVKEAVKELADNQAKPRALTQIIANNKPIEFKTKIHGKNVNLGKESIYSDKFLNKTTGVVIAGAAATGQIEKWIGDSGNKKSSDVIAYDLIIALDDYIAREGAESQMIDLQKLDLPKDHKFITLDKQKSVPLDQVISEIFQQHVYDQVGEGIGSRVSESLQTASKAVADAITGRTYDDDGNTLAVTGLIDIVGMGRMVSHDGYDVASLSNVNELIDETRSKIPDRPVIDALDTLNKIGVSSERLNKVIEKLPEPMQDAVTYVLPTDVALLSLDKSAESLASDKSHEKEFICDDLKAILKDLASKTAPELKKFGVSADDAKLIKTTVQDIEADDNHMLDKMMRPNYMDTLSLALLKAVAGGYTVDIVREEVLEEDSIEGKQANDNEQPEGKAEKDESGDELAAVLKKQIADYEKKYGKLDDAKDAENKVAKFEKPEGNIKTKGNEVEKMQEEKELASGAKR